MRARALIFAAVFMFACPKRVEQPAADPAKNFAGGTVLTQGGPKKYVGSEVVVEVRFKDGTPNCIMKGAVQYSRDDSHRWVWLEAMQGCPEWLTGRWWAELAVGGGGWYMQDISTTPVEDTR